MSEVILKRLVDITTSFELNLPANQEKTIIIFNNGNQASTFNLTAELAQNAKLNIYNVVTTNYNAHLIENITLNEQGANCNILNVILVGNNAKFTSDIMINHLAKETVSDFNNYAIALDQAAMTLNNNAKIIKGASKAVVHQKAKGLTLSKKAKIKAMPNLFIDEYDVIAAHAASIGSISKEDLFYLMSRGLKLDEASKLIVLGFIRPLLDNISDSNLKEEIKLSFENKL